MKIKKINLFVFSFLIIVIFLNSVSALNNISSYLYYDVSLNYSYGKIFLNSLNVVFSLNGLENSYNEDSNVYDAELKDFNGDVIWRESFSVPNLVIADFMNNETGELFRSEIITLNETEFNLFIPYKENAKEILISQNRTEVLRINVEGYSKNKENFFEEKEKIKENVENLNKNFNIKNLDTNYVLVFLILIVILIIFFIIFKNKKN